MIKEDPVKGRHLMSRFRGYGLAVISCGAALALASLINAPSSSFLLAVLVTSLYGGRGPAILSIALGTLAFDYYFVPPLHRFSIEPASLPRVGVFLVALLIVAALAESRRRSEDALRASERNSRLMVNSIPGLICIKTAAGEVENVNQPVLDYTGKTVEELKNWPVLVHPEDREAATNIWRHSIETGCALDTEFRVAGADGSYRWFHARGLPLRNPDGRIVRWYSLFTDIEGRKQAEEAARASEYSFRLILDSIPGLVCTMNAAGEVQMVNQRVLDYFGVPIESLKGWSYGNAVHPDDLPRVTEAWRRSVETGQPYAIEHRSRRADGVYRWFQVRGLLLRNLRGQESGWCILLTDIEERLQMEAKLRVSERDLLEAQRLTHIGSWKHDLQTGTVSVSPEIHRIWGANPDSDTSNAEFWFSIIHPEDRQRAQERFAKCEIEKTEYEDDYRIVLPDGTVKYQHSIGHPVLNESGELIEFLGTVMDVTEQVEARAKLETAFAEISRLKDRLWEENLALRATERELSGIIETIPGLVWCASPDGELTYINQRIADYIGTPKSNLTGSGWANFLHPEDKEHAQAAWLDAVANGKPFEIQSRLRRADGAYGWVHVLSQLGRDSDGHATRWYGMLLDIDDRKNMEESLRNTQMRLSRAAQVATVGELSASIAHEINQPLAAVVANGHACLRWLSASPPDLTKAREAAERIVRDGKAAGEVVQRTRALFKRGSADRIMLDLNDVIGEVLGLVKSEVARKRVAIELALETGLPPVLGDRVQLQQLILNLLLNGIEAMDPVPDGPRKAVIRSRREGAGAVLVAIRDHGVGLKDSERVFDAFFTTKENGMGMGLAICRSIVEAHHGRIWAESSDGPGATFCFTLPAQAGGKPVTQSSSASTRS